MGPAYHKGIPCPWGSLKIPLTKWRLNDDLPGPMVESKQITLNKRMQLLLRTPFPTGGLPYQKIIKKKP